METKRRNKKYKITMSRRKKRIEALRLFLVTNCLGITIILTLRLFTNVLTRDHKDD